MSHDSEKENLYTISIISEENMPVILNSTMVLLKNTENQLENPYFSISVKIFNSTEDINYDFFYDTSIGFRGRFHIEPNNFYYAIIAEFNITKDYQISPNFEFSLKYPQLQTRIRANQQEVGVELGLLTEYFKYNYFFEKKNNKILSNENSLTYISGTGVNHKLIYDLKKGFNYEL